MSTVSTTLTGTSSSDTLKAGSGDDIINAGAGDDTVRAGAGNDTVDGGTGNDVIYGEAGNDTLDGGAGSDWVDGGAGNDFFIYAFESTASRDTYIGGSGRDALQIRISKVDADRSGLSQQIAAFTQLVAAQATSGAWISPMNDSAAPTSAATAAKIKPLSTSSIRWLRLSLHMVICRCEWCRACKAHQRPHWCWPRCTQ